jgi:hypothetical protein
MLGDDRQSRAFTREAAREHESETARAAGNDDHLAREVHGPPAAGRFTRDEGRPESDGRQGARPLRIHGGLSCTIDAARS